MSACIERKVLSAHCYVGSEWSAKLLTTTCVPVGAHAIYETTQTYRQLMSIVTYKIEYVELVVHYYMY